MSSPREYSTVIPAVLLWGGGGEGYPYPHRNWKRSTKFMAK